MHVFVRGNKLLLPANATPVDVAYAMNTEVGNRCIAATVNGQLAFLSSPLADGDVVEIHTADGPKAGPSPEWLTFARTPLAQIEIERRLGLRASDNPEAAPPVPVATKVRIGRTAIFLELRRLERGLTQQALLARLATELGFPDLESMLVAVADHDLAAESVAQMLIQRVDDGAVAAATPVPRP
jgi:GTP pyrophosphokinase